MVVTFDGSYEGFLTLVYESYYKKYTITKIATQQDPNLFDCINKDITTDIQKAKKVHDAMKQKFSQKGHKRVLHSFMSKDGSFYDDLFYYIRLGFKDATQLENITNKSVQNIHNIEKKIFRSLHKAYGFTRFVELEDKTLYAQVKLEFYILPLLARHFYKRLGGHDFMIYDVGSKMVLQKKDTDMQILNVSHISTPPLSVEEQKYSKLWRVFFQSVSIESRENKKLQQKMLPLIYREYMTEF